MLSPHEIDILSKGILVATVIYCLYALVQVLKGDGHEHK